MIIGQERNGPLMGFYGPVHHPFRSHFPSGEGHQLDGPLLGGDAGDVNAPPVQLLQGGAGVGLRLPLQTGQLLPVVPRLLPRQHSGIVPVVGREHRQTAKETASMFFHECLYGHQCIQVLFLHCAKQPIHLAGLKYIGGHGAGPLWGGDFLARFVEQEAQGEFPHKNEIAVVIHPRLPVQYPGLPQLPHGPVDRLPVGVQAHLYRQRPQQRQGQRAVSIPDQEIQQGLVGLTDHGFFLDLQHFHHLLS